jgi:hypothetical protein
MPSNFFALNVPLVPLPEGSAALEAGAAPPGGPGLPGSPYSSAGLKHSVTLRTRAAAACADAERPQATRAMQGARARTSRSRGPARARTRRPPATALMMRTASTRPRRPAGAGAACGRRCAACSTWGMMPRARCAPGAQRQRGRCAWAAAGSARSHLSGRLCVQAVAGAARPAPRWPVPRALLWQRRLLAQGRPQRGANLACRPCGRPVHAAARERASPTAA